MVGIPLPLLAPTVFLSLPEGEGGESDPMDMALVLRGLSMLHPSLILLASTSSASGDPGQLLRGVKEQLQKQGIALCEVARPSPESLWKPVPLCRYFPPGISRRDDSLPPLPGRALPEGTLRNLPQPPDDPVILSLLSAASNQEIAGSLWWEGLLHGQPNAPVWLLGDRLLLLPNHAALPFVRGGLRIPRELDVPRSVASDDFLLKMEERERGILSPGFDSLWDHAVVLVGPPSLLTMASALATLRKMTAPGGFPLVWQAGIMLFLTSYVWLVQSVPRGKGFLVMAILLLVGLSGCWWSIRHGILPPILPWGMALTVGIAGLLAARGSRGR